MSDSTPTDYPPHRRHGAHRAHRSVLGALAPSVLAVAAVAALITALAVWQGEELDQPRAAASQSDQQARAGQAGASTQADSRSRRRAVAAAPSAAPATTPPASTSSTRVEGTKAAAPDLEVVVLNQTSRAGLAAQVADELRGEGWEVPAVGNFRGVVPSTTVYYPAGAETTALAVARDLPAEPRVRPTFGNLSTSRLTVVVTDSYPG
jgi:hypothetical protein